MESRNFLDTVIILSSLSQACFIGIVRILVSIHQSCHLYGWPPLFSMLTIHWLPIESFFCVNRSLDCLAYLKDTTSMIEPMGEYHIDVFLTQIFQRSFIPSNIFFFACSSCILGILVNWFSSEEYLCG